MAKYRQAARCDSNQPNIVEKLRELGISVSVNHDDILCGWQNRTYWYEIKDPEKAVKKKGGLKSGALKDSQIDLLKTWKGHYKIVWTLEMILQDMGII